MKATEFLVKLCREVMDLEKCGTFKTDDTPWMDLHDLFPFDSAKGVPCDNAMYFYRWDGFKTTEWYDFPEPDMTLSIDDFDEEIYLWKIE